MPDNPAVKSIDEILHLIIVDIVFKQISLAIAVAFPFLNLPIISTIYQWLMGLIAGAAYKPLENLVALGVISVQVDGQKSGYDAAKVALQKAQASGDKNAEEQAKADFKNKFRKLVHLDGG